MAVYYNENDPFAAAWLRELIWEGHLPMGDVDERDIRDVFPTDLDDYCQHHFFAGIGGWPLALRRAGWPDNKPVWTGSCPCQPFSAAGRQRGLADERHLWPAWFHHIDEHRPRVIFGEQVASKAGLAWLDLVQTDLESAGYACGALDLCAAGFGAPHIRQRLWIVAERLADPHDARPQGWHLGGDGAGQRPAGSRGLADRLADADRAPRQQASRSPSGDADANGGTRWIGREEDRNYRLAGHVQDDGTGAPDQFWRTVDWVSCKDGLWRPVEPGTSPLATRVSARVGRLRGYGNAINVEAAAAIIRAYMGV